MPQLDPTPWFFVIISSWVIFLILSPIKVTKFQHLNDPAPKTHKSQNNSWFWPWS